MLNRERFLRQLDICPPEKLAFPITVIGAGAIGSATVLTLAKMGCSNITVWDHDILEEHNIPNQICRPCCVGEPKVEALGALTLDLAGVSLKARREEYRGQRLSGVVIAAVDSMSTREEIWGRAKLNPAVPLLLDARMGGELARIYAINPMNPDEASFYEENVYPVSEAEVLPCSARAIIYCVSIVGGLVALEVKNYAIGRTVAREALFDLATLRLVIASAVPHRASFATDCLPSPELPVWRHVQ